MTTSTAATNRLRKLFNFQPYDQFRDSGLEDSETTSRSLSNELELANAPGWQGMSEVHPRHPRSPEYNADGSLEDLHHTLASLDEESDSTDQPTLPDDNVTTRKSNSTNSSQMSSDSVIEQADLLGLHGVKQDLEQAQHPDHGSKVQLAANRSTAQLPTDNGAEALLSALEREGEQQPATALLLHDIDRLRAQLAAADDKMQQMQLKEAAAREAQRAAEFQLSQSQGLARQARAAQSQAKAKALAAADAAAEAEARLAGQAVTGRGYMERIAQLKSQLHNLQQLVRNQDLQPLPVRPKRVTSQSQGTQTHIVDVASTGTEATCDLQRELEQVQATLTCTVAESKHREQVAQEHMDQLQKVHDGSDSLLKQLAEAQHAQHDLRGRLQESEQGRQAAFSQIAATQQLLASSQAELRTARSELQTAQAEASQVRSNLQASAAAASDLHTDLTSSQARVAALEQEVNEAVVKAATQQQHLQEHGAAFSKRQQQHAQEVAGLQASMRQHEESSQAAQDAAAQLQAKLADQQQTATAATAAAQQAQDQQVASLQQALDAKHASCLQAEQALAEASSRTHKLEQQIGVLGSAKAEFAAKSLSFHHQQAQAENQCKQQADNLAQLQGSFVAVTNERDGLQQQLEALVQQLELVKQEGLAGQSRLQDELFLAAGQVTTLQQQIDELTDVKADLGSALSAKDSLRSELNTVQQQLAEAEAKHSNSRQHHQAELGAAKSAQVKLHQQFTEAKAKHSAEQHQHQAELDTVQQQLLGAKREIAGAEDAAQQQLESLRQAQHSEQELTSQLAQSQQHLTAQAALAQQQATALKAMQAKFQASQAQAASAQSRLEASQQEVSLTKQQLSASKVKEAQLMAQGQTQQAEAEQLQQKLEASEQAAAQLRGKLASNAADLKASGNARDQMRVASEATRTKLQAKADEHRSEAEQLRKEAQASQQAAAQLQTQLDNCHARQQSLEQQLAKSEKLAVEQAEAAGHTTAGLTQQLAELHQAKSQLANSLASSQAAQAEAQSQLTAAQASQVQLQNQLQASEQTAAQVEQDMLDQQTAQALQLQAVQQSKLQLQEQLEANDHRTSLLQSQIQAQEQQLKAAEQKAVMLQTTLQSSNAELAETRTVMQAAQVQSGALQEQLSAAQEATSAVQARLEQAQAATADTARQLVLSEAAFAQLKGDLDDSKAWQAALAEAVQQAQQGPAQAQQAEQHFKQQLAALPALKAKQEQPDNPFGMHHRITEEPEAGLQSMLASEVARLTGELRVVEQRLQASEADVEKLMGMSDLGHTNSKQKIQYFVRTKKELEVMQKGQTKVLRERYILEQCVRYLAVRLGLNVAVVKDVFGQQERQAVDRLQPRSLAQHPTSGPTAGLSLSDIRPEDLDLFDMEMEGRAQPGTARSRAGSDVFYSPRVNSPRSSIGESVRSSFQEGSPETLEAVILSRVNAICQPTVYAKARQAQAGRDKGERVLMSVRGPATPDRQLSSK